MTFYDLEATTLKGETIALSRYAGKAILVVNTASKCGFTPQYAQLETLYQKYKDQGLVILGFPCNQFGQQEPGSAEEIASSCLLNYGVSFPMFAKIDVNGASASPVFRFLKKSLPGLLGQRIHWNFTKFLLGREGQPMRRYAPLTNPLRIEPQIRRVLGLG